MSLTTSRWDGSLGLKVSPDVPGQVWGLATEQPGIEVEHPSFRRVEVLLRLGVGEGLVFADEVFGVPECVSDPAVDAVLSFEFLTDNVESRVTPA